MQAHYNKSLNNKMNLCNIDKNKLSKSSKRTELN